MEKKGRNFEINFDEEVNCAFVRNKGRSKCFVGMNSTDYPGEENECDVSMFTEDSDIEGLGFDDDEIEAILKLNVGEVCNEFSYPGVYVMRLR